jgi:hypothetical protein
MGGVDLADQLSATKAGLRRIRRGGWQALEQWLFRTVLVNSYLVALNAIDGKRNRVINFRSQADFRLRIIDSLLKLEVDGLAL